MDKGHPGQMGALVAHFKCLRPTGRDPEQVIKGHKNDIQAITAYLTPVHRSLIEALPNLEIIACGAVGIDHIDLEVCRARNIAVTNTPDVLSADTADIAIFLLLAVARRAVEGDACIRAGLWLQGPLALGTTLTGKTLGIVGLGRVGQEVASRAEAFGMEVAYYGPREKTGVKYRFYADLTALAQACDFLVLTCIGGPDTYHLIDYKVLQALGPQGILINIARGAVVKEEDLLIALRNRTIAGAGLDVFENEPYVPESIRRMDNVVLTPHIGSATLETRTKMGNLAVDNLLAHFEGRPLLTPV